MRGLRHLALLFLTILSWPAYGHETIPHHRIRLDGANPLTDSEAAISLKLSLDQLADAAAQNLGDRLAPGEEGLFRVGRTLFVSAVSLTTYHWTHEQHHRTPLDLRPFEFVKGEVQKASYYPVLEGFSLEDVHHLHIGGLNSSAQTTRRIYEKAVHEGGGLADAVGYLLGKQDALLQWFYSYQVLKRPVPIAYERYRRAFRGGRLRYGSVLQDGGVLRTLRGDNRSHVRLLTYQGIPAGKEEDLWITLLPNLLSPYTWQSLFTIGRYLAGGDPWHRPWHLHAGPVAVFLPNLTAYRATRGYFLEATLPVTWGPLQAHFHGGSDLDGWAGDLNRVRLGAELTLHNPLLLFGLDAPTGTSLRLIGHATLNRRNLRTLGGLVGVGVEHAVFEGVALWLRLLHSDDDLLRNEILRRDEGLTFRAGLTFRF